MASVTRSESNKKPLVCGGTINHIYMYRWQICSNCVIMSKCTKISKKYLEHLVECHKESKQCWRQKGVQVLTSFNYWSGWWVYFCKFISDICFWKTYVTTMDLFETDRDKERKKGERLGTLYSGLDPWSNDANIWVVTSPTSVLGRRVRPTVEPRFQDEQCRFCCKYETVGHVFFLTKVL